MYVNTTFGVNMPAGYIVLINDCRKKENKETKTNKQKKQNNNSDSKTEIKQRRAFFVY